MWIDFAIALICASVLVVIAWGFKGRLLTPVKTGDSTEIALNVCITDTEPCLEQTLKSLVWLHQNGTLRADVVLNISTCDPAVHHIAEIYAINYSFIRCNYGDN